ncbi:zinc knuckle CX2CX4HX4C containing protein [Tanacetum coccineum]
MAGVDVDTLTMEQYLALSQENQAPGVFKPKIGGNVNFEIKSQFMRELREDAFFENKDEDAHDHIDRVLSIVGLFNIPGVTKDAGLSTMNRKLLDSHGPIPRMRPTEALTAIQTMVDHSQKWHDETTSRKMGSSNSNDGLAALVNKLDNLGRDMKKLKENVHAIQVGCQICEGPHLDNDCPLNEEVKQMEEVRYGEFGRTAPFNGNNGGKFHVGPPGYYTKIDNRPPYGEKRQSLEELSAKHQEESARRSTEIEEIRSDKTLDSSSKKIKTITADQETSGLNKLHGVSFITDPESDDTEVLQHQLPRKELNPGNFTLPCTIDKFKFYAMADLDMSKKASLGIVEDVLVKIRKFLFLSDFVIIDNTPFETTILGRPFLATIHVEIDVFARKISLGINEDIISFKSMINNHKYTNPSERIFMVRPQSPAQSNNQIDYGESAFENNPTHRSFDDYKWEFNLEIDKLAYEYELGIGKKGHILDNIWEYCNLVHNKNYEWHNYDFENEECEEIGIEDKDYHPPEVHVETFKVKKSSFKGGQSFICVTKDLDNTLPLGRKNGSKFKEMIQEEMENNKT